MLELLKKHKVTLRAINVDGKLEVMIKTGGFVAVYHNRTEFALSGRSIGLYNKGVPALSKLFIGMITERKGLKFIADGDKISLQLMDNGHVYI